MSGVFGIINPLHREKINSQLIEIKQKISHFQWYQSDTYLDEEVGVGLGRLGIGLFNRDKQPAFSFSGDTVVLVCGEFYGFSSADGNSGMNPDETISTAEFILHLYEQFGIACLPKLEGVFLLVIYDRRKGEIILANDRFGLYPLYYARLPQGLIFAPELKGILSLSSLSRKIDRTAIAEYVRFQCLLGERTFFEGVHLLSPATILVFSLPEAQIETNCYWNFSMITETRSFDSIGDAAQNAGKILQDAIQKRLVGDERPGIYLSGGLDSRVILGMGLRAKKNLVTVTYGLPDCRDVIYANQIARKAKTDHHYFEIRDGEWVKDYVDLHFTLTEGSHSWIHAHGISILGQVRSLIDVNLNGLSGEELNWNDPLLFQEQDEVTLATRLFSALTLENTWPSLTESEELLLFDTQFSKDLRGRAFSSLQSRLNQLSHFTCRQQVTTLSYEVTRRLFLNYTVFNRSHIEQRYPFYDYEYQNFIHSLPVNFLFNRVLRRAVLRIYCPELLSIPYAKDNLPVCRSESTRNFAYLMLRGKNFINLQLRQLFPENPELYVDYETWLRGELRDWGEELILGEQTMQRGVFNPDFLRALWRRFQTGSEVNIIGKIAPLMTLEMVFRKFLV